MTSAEAMAKLLEHMEKEEVFGFSVIKREDGRVTTAYEFGREAEDSPMVAGASYGHGLTLAEALDMNVREMRL